MRKYVVGISLVAFFAGTMVLASSQAQRRGRRGRHGAAQPAQPAEPPASAEIAKVLGDLHWGMTKQQVMDYFTKRTRERFQPQLAKARGAIEEDHIRRQLDQDLTKLRRSYTDFREGVVTGWEVSFLRDEFTAGNQESMLAVTDDNSQNFYFFIQGRLWKWYKAFDARVFAGMNFEQFADSIQHRFGQGRRSEGELAPGRGRTTWLEWRDEHSRLRAIDQTRFYGFYCLVFEDRETLTNLPSLRTHVSARDHGGHSVVDMVTQDDTSSIDPDVVDRLTGKIRRRTDATDAGVRGRGTGTGDTSTPPTEHHDSDPLRGLEL